MKYFLMTGTASSKWAYLAPPDDFDELKLWDLLDVIKTTDEWNLPHLKASNNKLNDMPSCSILGRIFSPRLMELLKPFVNDQVLWLPVSIDVEGEIVTYHFMHYLELNSILDDSCSGPFQKPVINSKKASKYLVTSKTHTSVSMYVHESVKDKIKQSGCTGIVFESLKVK